MKIIEIGLEVRKVIDLPLSIQRLEVEKTKLQFLRNRFRETKYFVGDHRNE